MSFGGKRGRHALGCFLVAILLVTGCGTTQTRNKNAGGAGELDNSIQSYRLGPNDALRIEVFGEEDLNIETEVSGHGTIKFPLIGELYVGGMTLKEGEESLTTRLKAGYLKNPKLILSIIRYRNFYVSGEARNPGAFPYQEGLTVLKAITLAGGWTEKADKCRTKVLRRINGKEEMVLVNLEESIHPDDIIIIPESFF